MLKANIFTFSAICFFIVVFFLATKVDGNQEPKFCLKDSYEFYKKNFMTKDGRIMDLDENNITTSEGQSYIMLRSLIMEDKETFDLVYEWAKDNLQRNDKLFAWIWGKNSNGEYGILDENSAADADVDISFALLLAYEKWGDFQYQQEAIPIIHSIWDKETRKVGNCLILMPGAKQNISDKTEVNPSYFSPYAFRFFQKYDNLHDWSLLIDSSYNYLDKVMAKTETGLPPNWFLIEDGQIILEDSPRSDFSYDAIRVFMRVYLDYIRTGEKRALPILAKSKFFIEKRKVNEAKNNTFYTNYKANGELRDKEQYVGSIAVLVPVIGMYDADVAIEIYETKLKPSFEDEKYWESNHDYYGKNLAWFGCYVYKKNSTEYKKMHKHRVKGF